MGRLLLRHDNVSGALRSVDGPPNGIVGLHFHGEHFSFIVNPYRELDAEAVQRAKDKAASTGFAGSDATLIAGSVEELGSVEIDTGEIVRACEGNVERYAIWMVTCEAGLAVVEHRLTAGAIGELEAFTALARDVYDALADPAND